MNFRTPAALLTVVAALALVACGDDGGSETTDADATVSTSQVDSTALSVSTVSDSTTEAASAGEMTAGEFLAAPIPDMSQAVKDLVAEHPEECGDVDPKDGGDFQQAFAIDAAQAAPDTPLSEIIVESCAEAGQGTS